MQDRILERRIGILLALGILGCAALMAADRFEYGRLENTARWVEHTKDVLYLIEGVDRSHAEAEAAQRAYLLTSDSNFLKGYRSTVAMWNQHLAQLTALTADNPYQQANCARLKSLVDLRISALDETIATRDANGLTAAVQLIGDRERTRVNNAYRQITGDMAAHERMLLEGRRAAERNARLLVLTTEAAAGAVLLLILGGGFVWVRKELRTRAAAQVSLAALLHSEEQLREQFALASDAIFVADVEARLTDVNHAGCALLGFSREEIIGKSIVEIIPPADAERLWQARTELLAGAIQVADWALRRKDGSYVPVEVSARFLPGGRWLGLARDITAQKRARDSAKAMTDELELRVAQRTEQLRSLVSEVEAAEDRERRQIARDLHDDIGQTLAAARIRLASLCDDERFDVSSTANSVGTLIDRANDSTRSLSRQLAPAVLYEMGLLPGLEWLGEEIRKTFGLRVTVVDDGQPKRLSQEASSILYRATRELLINVAKHAQVDSAVVESRRQGNRIVIRVADSGVGIDPIAIAAAPQRGLGLRSVHERLLFIGGAAEVQSSRGDGTVVVLSAPLVAGEAPLTERNT